MLVYKHDNPKNAPPLHGSIEGVTYPVIVVEGLGIGKGREGEREGGRDWGDGVGVFVGGFGFFWRDTS